jgi:hypothetical protein
MKGWLLLGSWGEQLRGLGRSALQWNSLTRKLPWIHPTHWFHLPYYFPFLRPQGTIILSYYGLQPDHDTSIGCISLFKLQLSLEAGSH